MSANLRDPAVAVALHLRSPAPGRFSIERVFDVVAGNLPAPFTAVRRTCPNVGQGFLDRVQNGLAARKAPEQVHHVTGDVHYLACFLPKPRTLLTVHDCSTLMHLAGAKRLVARLAWFWLPLRCASMVTTVSEFSRHQLLQVARCRPNKVRVVYDPLPPGFRPTVPPRRRERPVVLQVGTTWNKNLIRVAAAIAPLNCALWIVGSPDPVVMSEIGQLGVAAQVFTGVSAEELADLYRQCEVVVLASTYEGFGLPIIEAQASARPVITSNICSMPEVAGWGSCLVDPLDVISIRHAFERVLVDNAYYGALIDAGLRNIQRFSPEAIGREYGSLYAELMVNRSHRGWLRE